MIEKNSLTEMALPIMLPRDQLPKHTHRANIWQARDMHTGMAMIAAWIDAETLLLSQWLFNLMEEKGFLVWWY